jgi:hypothetical protein
MADGWLPDLVSAGALTRAFPQDLVDVAPQPKRRTAWPRSRWKTAVRGLHGSELAVPMGVCFSRHAFRPER